MINLFRDERGQEFSVFKLLISAVVAIAILALLFQILGMIPGLGSTDPSTMAKNTVTERLNAKGTPVLTDEVTFSRENAFLRPGTITTDTGISREQLCLSLGDFQDQEEKFVQTNDSLEYTGGGDLKVKLAVVCSEDPNTREEDIQLRCRNCEDFFCGGTGDDDPMDESGTVCIIGLVKT